MPKLTNAGTYRGTILDGGVSKSSGGFPQLVLKVSGKEYYTETPDGKAKEWVGLEDAPEGMVYLILVDGNGELTLNCKQVEKILTNWDGMSLASLAAVDFAGTPIQFRAEYHTYKNEERLQIEWVDEYDADPVQGVKKLDPAEVKALSAKFSKAFGGKKVAPASAKSGTKTAPPKLPVKVNPDVGRTTKSAVGAPPKIPVRPPTRPTVAETDAKKECSSQQAFDYVCDSAMWKKEVTRTDVENTWLEVLEEVGGDRADEDITSEEWFTIRDKVAKKVFQF